MQASKWKVAWICLVYAVCFEKCNAADYKSYKLVPVDEYPAEGEFDECHISPWEEFGENDFLKTGIFLNPSVPRMESDKSTILALQQGPASRKHGRDSGEHDDNSREDESDGDGSLNTDKNLCRVFHLSDHSSELNSWTGGPYKMQFTVTIEGWKNGCFHVRNLDVPDKIETYSRACYANGHFIEGLSKGMRASDTKNSTSGLTRGSWMVELVIVVYPDHDMRNLQFWWTKSMSSNDSLVPISVTTESLVVSERPHTTPPQLQDSTISSAWKTQMREKGGKARVKRDVRDKKDEFGGRVVITPLVIKANQQVGSQDLNLRCEKIGEGDFAECPHSGCAHYSFFCDGHFNCANTAIGDYDESWFICGWILRRVVLPMISLFVLTLAATAAVCMLRNRKSWLGRRQNDNNEPRAFRSGTESRRCSVHPLPLDANALETVEQRRRRLKAWEADGRAAAATVTDGGNRRFSMASRLTVNEQTPDLMLAPAYEHPPNYQTAMAAPVHGDDAAEQDSKPCHQHSPVQT